MLFRSCKKKQKHNISISINNELINQVKNTTFLSVVLDECLTWKDHINLISKKVIKASIIISRVRHFTLKLYTSLSMSHLWQPNMG
jgi:hypothetical protein